MLVATPSRMKMDGSWVIVQTQTCFENKIIESSIKDANSTNIQKMSILDSPDRALLKNFFKYIGRQGGRISRFTVSIATPLDPRSP